MDIHFKTSHASTEEEAVFSVATKFAERKLQTLKKYLARTEELTQVYVELGKISEAHQNGNVWRTQINLDSRGKRYHADSTAEKIELAIDKAVSQIESEIRKAKQKNSGVMRRGGNAVKSIMRGFKTT